MNFCLICFKNFYKHKFQMVILYTDLKSFCLKKVRDLSLKNIRHKKRDLI